MRDNPQHTIGMLGASWSTDLTRKDARVEWENAWTRMLKHPIMYAARNRHGPDQDMLERLVSVFIVNHLRYFCWQKVSRLYVSLVYTDLFNKINLYRIELIGAYY